MDLAAQLDPEDWHAILDGFFGVLSDGGGRAPTMNRVSQKCLFHCAKAFRRSKLWKPGSWLPRQRISFGRQIAPRLGGGEKLVKQIDDLVEADYKENI